MPRTQAIVYEMSTPLNEAYLDVEARLKQLKQPLPNILLPTISFTARVPDGIIGAGLLQCVPMVEPFSVDQEYEGHTVGARLFRQIEGYIKQNRIPRLFFHSEDKRMQSMLERAGARRNHQTWYEYRSEWGG